MKNINLKKIMTTFLACLVLTCGIFGISTFFLFVSHYDIKFSAAIFSLYFILLLIFSGLLFFSLFNEKALKKNSASEMYSLIITILFCFAASLLFGELFNAFLRPYILISAITFALYNKKTSFFSGIFILASLLIFDLIGDSLTVLDVITVFFAGLFGILLTVNLLKENMTRINYLKNGLYIGILLAVFTFIITVFIYFGVKNVFVSALKNAGISFISPLIAVILMFAILPLFERITNTSTNFRLYELCDSSKGLLFELKEKAAGTFNHTQIVANLAEICAIKIGIDPQIARAAACYHDVGKITNAEYYTENQTGSRSPHEDIAPELSVKIIKSHIINGYELCLKNNIPTEIADICLQHHGTLPITFFYAKAKKLTEGNLKIDEYCYPGPKPQSKTAALIMLVDGCEAAIRASNSKDIEKIEEIVSKIIDNRIEFEQFSECDLSFKDLISIKEAIVANYSSIYHGRIKYPKIKISKEER